MPFNSKAQAAEMFANDPKLAKEFAAKTASLAKLPEHVADGKKKKPVAPKPV